jgi:hypothetical protein
MKFIKLSNLTNLGHYLGNDLDKGVFWKLKIYQLYISPYFVFNNITTFKFYIKWKFLK